MGSLNVKSNVVIKLRELIYIYHYLLIFNYSYLLSRMDNVDTPKEGSLYGVVYLGFVISSDAT
jgi:hypothetical protein